MTDRSISSYYEYELYHEVITKLRGFFLARNYIEVDSQSPQHILAACEDPKTVATYTLNQNQWPLPQTGQMWLEEVLLKNPHLPGVFCLTTSYRDEPCINPTRHLRSFPLFEFETHGDLDDLQKLMTELFVELGLGTPDTFVEGDYEEIADHYGVKSLEAQEEMQIAKDFGTVFFLKNFPYHSHPFFNMKRGEGAAKKIDCILFGMETVGSAERSCSSEEMWEDFHTSSEGEYAKLLFDKFGKENVLNELKNYLSLDFIPRCGGGIGINRLLRAIILNKELITV